MPSKRVYAKDIFKRYLHNDTAVMFKDLSKGKWVLTNALADILHEGVWVAGIGERNYKIRGQARITQDWVYEQRIVMDIGALKRQEPRAHVVSVDWLRIEMPPVEASALQGCVGKWVDVMFDCSLTLVREQPI